MTPNAVSTLVPSWSGTTYRDSTADRFLQEEAPDPWDTWVITPTRVSRPAPHTQIIAQAVLDWTGWSQRRLSQVLQVSHPTVAALVHGKSEARIGDLFERLTEVHAVAKRVNLLADQDIAETNRLMTSPSDSGDTAMELLSQRQPAGAYLAALDVLHRHRAPSMMQSVWPAKTDQATVALFDG